MSHLTLYSYFRSSAAYRARIVLGLKDLDYQQIAIHLVRNGGEQNAASYLAINPQGLVPSLQHGEAVLTQSIAICEYIDEVWPYPALLPRAPLQRAYVRSLIAAIACEIHPVNNLRILEYLTARLGVSDADRLAWYRHWVFEGFSAIQRLIESHGYAGRYCCGDVPGLADAFLVPQIFNARRFEVDLRPFSRLVAIDQACAELPAFKAAHPDRQPDAPIEAS